MSRQEEILEDVHVQKGPDNREMLWHQAQTRPLLSKVPQHPLCSLPTVYKAKGGGSERYKILLRTAQEIVLGQLEHAMAVLLEREEIQDLMERNMREKWN